MQEHDPNFVAKAVEIMDRELHPPLEEWCPLLSTDEGQAVRGGIAGRATNVHGRGRLMWMTMNGTV